MHFSDDVVFTAEWRLMIG